MNIRIGKIIFICINLALLGCSGFWGYRFYLGRIYPVSFPFDTSDPIQNNQKQTEPVEKNNNRINRIKMITDRNLFDVDLIKPKKPSKSKAVQPEILKKTTLDLVLRGTVTGDGEGVAIIEDKKLRQQSLYRVGDTVQGATVQQVHRHRVILELANGTRQILTPPTEEVESKTAALEKKKPVLPPAQPVTQSKKVKINSNPATGLNKVRFRPNKKNGETDGMMIYGVRPKSTIHLLGIQNGDIIRQVDGETITQQDEAAVFFDRLPETQQGNFTYFRRGKLVKLSYTVENGHYLIDTETVN